MFAQNKMMRSSIARSVFRETVGSGGSDGFDDAGETTSYHVSGVNDPAEIQAERDADRVTGSTFHDAPVGGDGIFRADDGAGDAGGDVSLPTADLEGPSESLPPDLQGNMEQSYGTSFSGVRVHTGASADRLSRGLSARAFTRGEDMYFRDGEYKPDTKEGQHLIAHELSHVASGGEGLHREFMPDDAKRSNNLEELAKFAISYCDKASPLVTLLGQGKDEVTEAVTNGVREEELKEVFHEKDNMKNEITGWLEKLNKPDGTDGLVFPKTDAGNQAVTDAKTKLGALKDQLENLSVGTDVTEYAKTVPIPEPVKTLVNDPACKVFMKLAGQVAASNEEGGGDEGAKLDRAQAAERAGHDRGGKKHYEDIEESAEKTKAKRAQGIAEAIDGSDAGSLDDYKKETKVITKETENKDAAISQNTDAEGYNDKVDNYSEGIEAGAKTGKALASGVSTFYSAKDLYNERKEKNKKIEDLENMMTSSGVDKSQFNFDDDKAKGPNAELASSIANTLADATEAGGSIAKASGMKDDKDQEGKKEAAFGLAASSARAVGDVFEGMGAGKDFLDEGKKKDLAEKRMKTVGTQLEKETNSRAGKDLSKPNTQNDRNTNVHKAAIMMKEKEPGNEIADGIEKSLEPSGNDPKTPDLSGKQRRLLMTAQALNKNVANSSTKRKNSAIDMFGSAMGFLGNVADIVASVLTTFFGKEWGGAITAMVKQGVSVVKGSVEAFKDEKSEEQERNDQMSTARQALQVMAGLPVAPEDDKINKIKASTNGMVAYTDVTQAEMSALTEYANVFDMIKSSGLEMVDILHAINGAEFGETGKSNEEKMRDTYKNLSFSGG